MKTAAQCLRALAVVEAAEPGRGRGAPWSELAVEEGGGEEGSLHVSSDETLARVALKEPLAGAMGEVCDRSCCCRCEEKEKQHAQQERVCGHEEEDD